MFIQFVLCSLFIWQIGLICWLLIRYWLNNKASVNGGIEEKQHVFKKALKKHPQGAVDISVDISVVGRSKDLTVCFPSFEQVKLYPSMLQEIPSGISTDSFIWFFILVEICN